MNRGPNKQFKQEQLSFSSVKVWAKALWRKTMLYYPYIGLSRSLASCLADMILNLI